MSSSKRIPQSAAERRSTEAAVRLLISRLATSRERLIGAARRWVLKRLPTAHELVYEYRDWFVISYSPSEHGYEGVLSVRGNADGVKLFLNRGKELSDPEKLLKGSGKQTRWIPLDRVSTLARSEVISLIEDALALNQVPFATSGRGSVNLRSSSAS